MHPITRAAGGLSLAFLFTASSATAQLSLSIQQEARVKEKLGVTAFQTREIVMPEIPEAGGFELPVHLEGEDYVLDMHPHSLRSRDFRLIEIVDGEVIDHVPPPPSTYRGDVLNDRGEVVGKALASAVRGKLDATIRLEPTRKRWLIQPLSDALELSPQASHVLYHEDDTIPADGVCGNDFAERDRTHTVPVPSPATPRAAGDSICDIAIDIDKPYWNWAGKDFTLVVGDMESVMLNVSEIYETEVDITYEITLMCVRRTWDDDPYSTKTPGPLLNQFGSEWSGKDFRRDVAHLFTGRELAGSTIGIASLTVICSDFSGYGLSQTNFSSSMAFRAGLTAHELGHNWSASHCDSAAGCQIMCSVINGCASGLTRFNNQSETSINNHLSSRNCLSTEGADISLPFFDDFETGSFDTDKWTYINQARIRKGAVAEPSGVWSLKMKSFGDSDGLRDDVRSNELDSSGASQVNVSFYTEARDVDDGEWLRVQYYSSQNRWLKFAEIFSDGTTEDTFTFHSFSLPSDAFHDRMRIRFFAKVNNAQDKWFIDDVSVTTSAALTVDQGWDENGNLRPLKFHVVGAPPHRPVILYGGFDGLRGGAFQPSKGMELDLEGAATPLAVGRTDEQGRAVLSHWGEMGIDRGAFHVQALILDGDEGVGSESTPPVKVRGTP